MRECREVAGELEPPPPRVLTWRQAETMRRPRRCNVPWHRRGGALCCELCTNQVFDRFHVYCLATEEPPLFRRRKELEAT